ncbi:MAG: sulfotransferase [Planctomycetota bacterium]|nr:sulfotransferase [Planctomycetota bacterium]MDA1257660.1 sulfotransferase [Chloroflexota bacterium]
MPRSGSSLLRTVIDGSRTIVSPDETGFFLRPLKQRQSHAGLERSARRADRVLDIGLEPVRAIIAAADNELECFDALMAAFVFAHGIAKDVWAEKSPRNCEHYGRLAALDGALVSSSGREQPPLFFLSTVRDARGVLTSVLDEARGYHCSIERYCEAARHIRDFRHPRHLVVRYEDFVADPPSSARRVLDFLGEPFDMGMLDRYQSPSATTKTSAERQPMTVQPITVARVSGWKDPRHADRLREIASEPAIGALNAAFGYGQER